MNDYRRIYRVTDTRTDWPFTKERSDFSKCGQDGVLEALLGEDAEPGFCVEIGSGNGEQNNTRALVDRGWQALWIDPHLDRTPPRAGVRYRSALTTAETIREDMTGAPKKFDVLSIDIDGVDYYVVAELLKAGFRPRIAVIEYNASWGSEDAVAVAYDTSLRWAQDDYFSASLPAWADLFAVYGYGLIGCESVGADAFFQQGAPIIKASEAFRPPAYNKGRGHRPSKRMPEIVLPPEKPTRRKRRKKAAAPESP